MSNKETKKPSLEEMPIEERMASAEGAINAIIMYINTLEKWRHMDFKPPQKEGESTDGKAKPGKGAKKDSGEKKAK